MNASPDIDPSDPSGWTDEDMLRISLAEIVRSGDGLLTASEARSIRWGGNAIDAVNQGRTLWWTDGDVMVIGHDDAFVTIDGEVANAIRKRSRHGFTLLVLRLRQLMERRIHVEYLPVGGAK